MFVWFGIVHFYIVQSYTTRDIRARRGIAINILTLKMTFMAALFSVFTVWGTLRNVI